MCGAERLRTSRLARFMHSLAPDFLSTLAERQACYEQILQLSRRQADLIAHDDYTELLVVLGQKQRLIGRLEEIVGSQPQFWGEWKSCRPHLAANVARACEECIARTEQLLTDLALQEAACAQKLLDRKNDTRTQLAALQTVQRTQSGYQTTSAPLPHRLLDVDQ